MKIFEGFENIDLITSSVVTIGTYDGIHAGHKKVLKKLTTEAKKEHCVSVVITFSPHPRLVLYPEQKDLKLIDSEEEKIEKFKKLNIDILIIVPFTKEFASLSYISFVEDFLIKKLNIRKFVLGKDHKLGKQREGDFFALQKLALRYGFTVDYVQTLVYNGIEISSSKIRKAIINGDIECANLMIGDLFTLKAHVVEGRKIGQQIGFPTANLSVDDPDKLIPSDGVYAVRVILGNLQYNGMLNIGKNPTVNADNNIKIEVHIFEFNKIIYGNFIEILFVKKIRDEIKFDNLELLRKQLESDKINAEAILKNVS